MSDKIDMGMSVLTAIRGRRSLRCYAPGKLEENTVRILLDAAVQAPTAVHEEPWAFAVIQDLEILKRISDRVKAVSAEEARKLHLEHGGNLPDRFADPDFNIFYNAGTLIVIYGKPPGKFVAADCWLAAENLILAAYSMGLGTCVIGSAVEALNSPETKAELGISEKITAHVPIIVGVRSGVVTSSSRKAPDILIWK